MFQYTSESKPLSNGARRGKPLATLVMLVLCFCPGNLTLLGQEPTTSPGGKPSPPPGPTRTRPRTPRRLRPTGSAGSRGSVSEESDRFLSLGDQFAEKNKWNAAEAAYNEATKLSSGNADAWAALGYLYVDQGNLSKAYRVYNRLRAINSKMAEELLAEIKKK